MAGGLDTFLNFFVPAVVIFWFAFIIYKGVKEPADRFFAWVAAKFKNMTSGEEGYRNVIVYE